MDNDQEAEFRNLINTTTSDEVTLNFFDFCLKRAYEKNKPKYVGYVMYKSPNNVNKVIQNSFQNNQQNVTALLCWAAIENNHRFLEFLLSSEKQHLTTDLNLPDEIKQTATDDLKTFVLQT